MELSREELSLLLFFESAFVELGGLIDTRHMNREDLQIAKRWNETGFVKFSLIKFSDIQGNKTHACVLSDEAFTLAHIERKARAFRLYEKRNWITTQELNT